MVNDLDLLRCLHCGRPYHPDEQCQKKNMICLNCGMEMFPLVGKTSERGTPVFYVLWGFSAIVALLGALGGVMLVHGWNFWVTFSMVGGIIYFVGKIFMDKYQISEIVEYVSNEIVSEDCGIKQATGFDELVVDAINELPQGLKDRLSTVSIVVEGRPPSHILEKLGLLQNKTLLGLFQGVPLNKRSVWQSGTMPEKITLFQKNIEAVCRSDEEIKWRIKEVVRHEVAHFFGFTEEEIRQMGY